MTRFGFNIRTRSGQKVDNISILAANREEAERRLKQMYYRCEIIECRCKQSEPSSEPLDMENIISLISRRAVREPSGTH
ncbi:hypothetical protein BURK2_03107 [Burkholderiales bacterium]|nr:MAG: hypothetical protein F9K47_12935 [Burkholderiales bacterium]CAG1002097.1 hypothetical protein BURK2_03107 [Burkholderiales bacterium]